MNKKLFLTSIIAIGFAMPAMAAYNENGSKLTSNDTMLAQDTLYANGSATSTVLNGVDGSSGNKDVNAKPYYFISPGMYLEANATLAKDCPVGSYCLGAQSVMGGPGASATSISSCSTGFTSESGTGQKELCYKTCTTSDVANSKTVNGRVYDATSGGSWCVASACNDGFIKSARTNFYKMFTTGTFSACSSNCSSLESYEWGASIANEGYIAGNWGCSLSNAAAIRSNSPEGYNGLSMSVASDSVGNCYCKVTKFYPSGGTVKNVSGSDFVLVQRGLSNCQSSCKATCASNVVSDATLRGNLALHTIDNWGSSAQCIPANVTFNYPNSNNTVSGTVNSRTVTATLGTPGGVSGQTDKYSCKLEKVNGAYQTYSLPTVSNVTTGYSFQSWSAYTAATGGTSIKTGLSGSVTCNVSNLGKPTEQQLEDAEDTYTIYLRPVFDANMYTITLNDNGGSGGTGTAKVKYTYGWRNTSGTQISSIKIPTKSKAVFLGYYAATDGSTQRVPASGSTSSAYNEFTADTTVYAHWGTCTGTSGTGVVSGGCVADSVTSNKCVYAVTFANGYYGSASQTNSTAATASYTCTATACTNKPSSNASYTGPSATNANACPWQCSTGYSTTGKKAGATTGTESGKTCSAIDDYAITLNLNGGTYSNAPTTYKYGVGVTLGTPTKTGYNFQGWCENSTLTSNCSTSKVISTSATGDKTFWAKWGGKTIDVTWYGVGSVTANSGFTTVNATDHTTTSQLTYGGYIRTPASSAGAAYGQTFLGWKFVKPSSN